MARGRGPPSCNPLVRSPTPLVSRFPPQPSRQCPPPPPMPCCRCLKRQGRRHPAPPAGRAPWSQGRRCLPPRPGRCGAPSAAPLVQLRWLGSSVTRHHMGDDRRRQSTDGPGIGRGEEGRTRPVSCAAPPASAPRRAHGQGIRSVRGGRALEVVMSPTRHLNQ